MSNCIARQENQPRAIVFTSLHNWYVLQCNASGPYPIALLMMQCASVTIAYLPWILYLELQSMWVHWILYCIIILQNPYWWIALNCIVSIAIHLVAFQCIIAVHCIALYFIVLHSALYCTVHSISASLVGRVQRGVKETDRVTNQAGTPRRPSESYISTPYTYQHLTYQHPPCLLASSES